MRSPYLLDVSRLIWRRWAGRHPTGIDRVCLAYLDHFAEAAQAVVQYHGFRRILDRDASAWLFRLVQEPSQYFRRDLVTGLARRTLLNNEPGAGRLYLNIGHTGLHQAGLGEWTRKANVRPIYFVHDLIPITHPQFCRPREEERHRLRMLTLLDSAAGVIGNSQATVDDLEQFATAQGRAMPPSIPAWLGVEDTFIQLAAPAPTPAFVALGTIEARKNHMLLLNLWSKLLARSDAVPKLLLIGQRGWECDDVFERLDKDERLRGHVVELNSCSDAEMARHVASARALLFPSLAEGFGLPLVEALAAGTPAIASDLPVFREIGQGVPELIDPLDISAWEDAVLAYANLENPRRQAQLDRLCTFKPFRWPDHFAAIGPWLEKL